MSNYREQYSELLTKLLPPEDIAEKELSYCVEKIYHKYFAHLLIDRNFGIKLNSREISNVEKPVAESREDLWIFGYGSLMWKADFPYINRVCGYICSVQRRFYQNSIDHRGTPERPGRVVTLLEVEGENNRVYGIAYRIAAAHKHDVLRHLDYREKNGYKQKHFKFHELNDNGSLQNMQTFDIILYIASQSNESFAGKECDLSRIATVIQNSVGSSGPNRDYLFNLASAMRNFFPGIIDDHLFDLERILLRRIQQDELPILQRLFQEKITKILRSVEEGNSICNALQSLDLLKVNCSTCNWQLSLSMNTIIC